MMQEMELPFQNATEFTEMAKALDTLRVQHSELTGDTTCPIAQRKSRIIAPIIDRLDTLIYQFNNDFLPYIENPAVENAGLEKMLLRLDMLLVCSSISQDGLDTLSEHRYTAALFARFGAKASCLTAGFFAGVTLAGPWGAVPGAYAGHKTSASILSAEPFLPQSAQQYLQLFRAIQNAPSLSREMCSPETCALLDQIFTPKKVVWIPTDKNPDTLPRYPNTLYLQLTAGNKFLCHEGVLTRDLTSALRGAGIPFRARYDDHIVRFAYLRTAIAEKLEKPRPDMDATAAPSPSVASSSSSVLSGYM